MAQARLQAIDDYRGFAILLMVPADFLARVRWVPAGLRHAPDVGYTVIDLIAPMFVFAIGLTFGLSFRRRRERDGLRRAIDHFAARYLALLGLGSVLTLAGDLTGIYPSPVKWGLLQALGAAGLLTLPVICLRPAVRLAAGLAMLAAYQLMLDGYWLDAVRDAVHNGPWGALSWGAALVLSTAMADLYHDGGRGRRYFLPLCVAAVGVALLLAGSGVPISKGRASASYMILSVGLSGLIFSAFHALEAGRLRLPVLGDWGRNPLLLYLLHGVCMGVFSVPGKPALYTEAPVWLSLMEVAAIVGVMSLIARWLARRGWAFAL